MLTFFISHTILWEEMYLMGTKTLYAHLYMFFFFTCIRKEKKLIKKLKKDEFERVTLKEFQLYLFPVLFYLFQLA